MEEMQKLEQEKVGDLLEGDFAGGTASGNASGLGATVTGTGIGDSGGGGGGSAGADLLGFGVDRGPYPPAVDVFGGAAPPSSSTVGRFGGGDPNADLLGFSGATDGGTGSALPSAMPGSNPMTGDNGAMMGRTNNLRNDVNGNAAVAMAATEASEDALAENSRRMQMAAGLFAGVVPNHDNGGQNNVNPRKKPVMVMGNNSGLRISAWMT